MALDTVWAASQLTLFLNLTRLEEYSHATGIQRRRVGSRSDILESSVVVEKIFDRLIPNWLDRVAEQRAYPRHDEWDGHVDLCRRAKVLLGRRDELDRMLGDDAPELNAGSLHPWIWNSAKSLWASGHYREAVGVAAVKLNAELQNKSGRRDISETDLFKQVFSLDAPQRHKARLRIMEDDGSKTYSSLHRGVMAFAEGCYAAIRNPISHGPGELGETEALEELAAFSVLARWVDRAILIEHS